MIDVNVAETIYCSPLNLFCHPLDWWSSAASWAQAILTAATFLGTVIYQAKQNSARELAERKRESRDTNVRRRREMALARIIAARELRRWRRAIRSLASQTFEDEEKEMACARQTLEQIKWEGTSDELVMLGEVAEILVDLIATADEISDSLAHPSFHPLPLGPNVSIQELRELWTRLEAGITSALESMEKTQNRLATH
ncbi:hypothetical protein [Stenotrophomonas maltophilia]|uniref:hypothetical protein n=1 Tax=Stenotrophomonas maltophilia TaxID=40324 RepID=UPI001FA6DAB6|nr:hypothetical protein [Stenotrophomonas maltophilia]